jgi:FlaG/FlaF family flagellin (archaellin)
MKIHIVGAGPTGLSLAWEIVRSTDHEVTVYERKTSCGGSWWEPDTEVRDIHAHRVLFDQFVNARSFLKEMDLEWDELFQKISPDFYTYTLKKFEPKDYVAVVELFFRVMFTPKKYQPTPFHNYFENKLSDGGKKIIEHLPINIDGVTWKHMSTFEFIKTVDQLLFSTPYTQKVSGKIMNDAIEEKLLDAGVNFIFGSELQKIDYRDDGYEASFSDGTVSSDGMFFMCIDNSPALKLIGDNWGPLAEKKIRSATYGSICVLLDYDEFVRAGEELETLTTTKWNILVSNLPGTKTVSCVLCDLTKEILASEPDVIKREVIHQLGLPPPREIRIGWGSEWTAGEKWEFSQSSGVLGLNGQVPFFGKCPNVAMVGMMSYRDTAYSSIEAAVEVSRKLSHECFGTRRPIKKVTVSQVITITVVVLIVLILVYRNKNQ